MSRISESELILPTLLVLSLNGGIITTSGLIAKLREILNPQGEDLEILKNRSDDKFSQKVRNLVSHRTLEDFGYAEYQKSNKSHEIKPQGTDYLQNNEDILMYILSNNFGYDDVIDNLSNITQKTSENKKLKVQQFDEDYIINEGLQKFRKYHVYDRSNKLRKYAIEHFEHNGIISCKACDFVFEKFYGEYLGKGFIEIHHIKPIFQYEGDDINKTIHQALQNLVPLCSNCHRIVHRKRDNILNIDIPFLKSEIIKTGAKIIFD
jgi:predicted HNH restriction endonuclease